MLLRVFILVIFAFPALAKTTKSKPAQDSIQQLQIMVVVKTGAKLADWGKLLPQGAQMAKRKHPFYLIRLKKPITDAELAKLRESKFIKRVLRDKLVRPAQAHDQCTQRPPSQEAIASVAEATEEDCLLGRKCGCNGTRGCSDGGPRTMLSAQMAMGGDLMLEELNRIGLAADNTKIAVLDTGYSRNIREFISNPPESFVDYAGQNAWESTGHGTRVMALISGTDGIGLAPSADVGIYKIDNGEDGNTTESTAYAAALNACQSGYKIINLSYAGLDPEHRLPDVIDDLARNGCIVVQAAGTNRDEDVTSILDDAWLRIGGVNADLNLPDGHRRGELTAPSFAVATLSASGEVTCGGMPITMVDGTSYSAPLVASVLFNVRGILNKDPKFQALTGYEQVSLLNRILRASVRRGIINGLRAVLIADQWTKTTGEFKPLTQADIDRLLVDHPPELCSKPTPRTDLTMLVCADRKAAFNEMRSRLAACEPPDQPGLIEMANSLAKLNEPEHALNFVHYSRDRDGQIGVVLTIQETARIAAQRSSAREAIENELEMIDFRLREIEIMGLQSINASDIATIRGELQTELRMYEQERSSNLAKLEELNGFWCWFCDDEIKEVEDALKKNDQSIACARMWIDAYAGLPSNVSPGGFYNLLRQTHAQNPVCQDYVQPMSSQGLRNLQNAAFGGVPYDEYRNRVDSLRTEAERERAGALRRLNEL